MNVTDKLVQYSSLQYQGSFESKREVPPSRITEIITDNVMAENTRYKGRASTIMGTQTPPAHPASPASPAATAVRPPGPPPPPPPPPATAEHQVTSDAKLDLILARLDTLDEMKAALVKQEVRSEETRKDHAEGIARLTRLLEENQVARKMDKRDLMIATHELVVVKEQYKRLETQLNEIVNHQRICNVRVDGKKEDTAENLKRFIVDLSAAMGVNNMMQGDVITVYRLGKQTPSNARARPRTIMVTFVNQKARNAFFYARTTLKNQERYRGIFINDDVSQVTRRQRDDYRAVAAIARQDGIEVRVHTDGLGVEKSTYSQNRILYQTSTA